MSETTERTTNSIKFFTKPGDDWAPDFDCMYVYKDMVAQKNFEGATYRAGNPNNILDGTCKITSNDYSSDGKAAAYFGKGESDAITFTNIAVQGKGVYQFGIKYSNGLNSRQELFYRVNDGQEQSVYLSETYSRNIFDKMQATVYLEEGNNQIKFYTKDEKNKDVMLGIEELTIFQEQEENDTHADNKGFSWITALTGILIVVGVGLIIMYVMKFKKIV